MFGLGVPELLIILAIIVLFVGLGKLPRAAGQLGEGFRSFREAIRGEDDEIEIDAESEPAKIEDKEAGQALRDASVPQNDASERPADKPIF